jgi:hypothetical protein
MSRVVLCTVSDDRFGRKDGAYKATQIQVGNLIQNSRDFGVDIVQWDWIKLIETEFYRGHKLLLDNIDPARNGRAYKPFVIFDTLQKVAFGEIVVYNDCSPELWGRVLSWPSIPAEYELGILERLVERNGDILSPFVKWDSKAQLTNGLGIHTHDNFTLNRCIKRMSAWEHQHDFQHASGFIAIRKTQETMDFVREWMHWNCIDECASMGWAHVNNDYSFWNDEEGYKMGHRHDQSISGLLINKRGGYLIDQPLPYEDINPYNFLQYCRPNVKYQFINSINPSKPKADQIRKGSIVKNRKDVVMRVFEVWPENGEEVYRVGIHKESTYKTTAEHLKLIQP